MEGTPGNTFGSLLPDQFDKIASYFETHLELIGDIREIYAARVALEREYAGKLQALARKAADKKAKMEHAIAVGTDPSKSWDAGTLKACTLNAAYDEIIASVTGAAEDHGSIADAVNAQVVEVLRVVERRSDEVKKKEMAFFNKLLADRDQAYANHQKSKQKYDDDCIEVESFRQKQSRANDDKHAERAAKQAEQQRTDMLNSKNVYLISISVANQAKDRFYSTDLPRLEDEYQGLQTRLGLKHAWLDAVDTIKDQALFSAHNARPFTMPGDWKFEPCPGHYDTDEMSVDPAPKVFIQNKLRRCKEKLGELQPVVYSKKTEVAGAASKIKTYQADHTLGPIDDQTDAYIEAEHQLALYQISEHQLNAEIQTITAAIGADVGGQNPHNFKSSSFSIPTTCGYCKASIWGLTKQGKTCKSCGVSVHTKCELKFPANCGQKDSAPPSTRTVARTNTVSSTSSRTSSVLASPAMPVPSVPTASSFVKDTHSDNTSIAESYPTARVLFDFKASSEFELAVSEDEVVQVVEEDDGSGWMKVLNEYGETGLVPATYLEEEEAPSTAVAMPTPTPGRGGAPPVKQNAVQGSGEQVRAVYAYAAQGADELGLAEGEVLELSSGPRGGKYYGEGWWEGRSFFLVPRWLWCYDRSANTVEEI
ncbi:hypothetical protein DFP72DRAFT_1094692 [Ephemerocybe angulata]|uniref:Uncharacterized protein n=1 Tax=Ephemerocybe angulata TaxID=980116 RepID=A0A8H6HE22_9AGAR|nr:hypothetical protein DFP72DRAFT_1094692 [Tulosesus angulatus]